jgi:hypothetical protein
MTLSRAFDFVALPWVFKAWGNLPRWDGAKRRGANGKAGMLAHTGGP